MGKQEELTNVSKYSFEDLFDIQKIEELQDAIAKAVGVGIQMLTPDWRALTKNSIACEFCSKVVRSSEQGRLNCKMSDGLIGRPNKEGPVIAPCRSAGLLDAGASIIIGDTHVASWLLGQVRDADNLITEEEGRKRAQELGIDPDWYWEELCKVPAMTKEQFTNVVNLVYVVANQLSQLGLKNYLQNEEIRRREELQEQLTYINRHDALTGLYNRMVYEEKVKELAGSNISPISVVVADANYLKLSNDIFGHEEGDRLLKQLADALQHVARPEDIVCRCGGDEFYVLLPGAGKEEAEEYILKAKEYCHRIRTTVLPPSMAVGIETKDSKDVSLEKVIQWAEDRMYQNKDRIKKESNVLGEIRKILYDTGYLSETSDRREYEIAEAFANYLGFDDYRKSYVRRVLLVKNLGLIVVPRTELVQAREYMDYMFDVRYGSAEIEYRLAKMFDETLPVARIIGQRMEQWNGNGRPNGIKGEKLDYLTRFLSMTDAYTILTGRGPHGYALPQDAALKKMLQIAGTVLDPQMTAKFVAFMEQYEIIK